jgi:hypothetical protein
MIAPRITVTAITTAAPEAEIDIEVAETGVILEDILHDIMINSPLVLMAV